MNPYDQAHALARALKESEEYREYARLKDVAYEDATNKALLDEYKKLTPCAYCGAPLRKSAYLEMYKAAADEAGIEIPEAYLAMFE